MNQWKIFIKTINIMGKRCFLYFLGILFMSIGWSLFAIMTSLLMKNVVDAAENGNATKIPLIIIGNIICGFISLVIYRGAAILYNVEAKRAYANLCKNVFAKEIKLPFSYYEKHHSGEFISKISYDLEKMGSNYDLKFKTTSSSSTNFTSNSLFDTNVYFKLANYNMLYMCKCLYVDYKYFFD